MTLPPSVQFVGGRAQQGAAPYYWSSPQVDCSGAVCLGAGWWLLCTRGYCGEHGLLLFSMHCFSLLVFSYLHTLPLPYHSLYVFLMFPYSFSQEQTDSPSSPGHTEAAFNLSFLHNAKFIREPNKPWTCISF